LAAILLEELVQNFAIDEFLPTVADPDEIETIELSGSKCGNRLIAAPKICSPALI
jgi:hypothetical protein